jgi:hypothetical protein
MGCATTATGAAFIAGGMAYDNVLVESGRERLFLPMMGTIFKGVFGEAIPNQGNNSPGETEQIPVPYTATSSNVLEAVA